VIASVNAAEIVTRLMREGLGPDAARLLVINLGCPILAVDAELGLRAGALAAESDKRGLSLGDRCCLALAEREGLPALTADRSWAELGLPIRIKLIR
jgi:PIN domain nuclease of toxin-antitoxin system